MGEASFLRDLVVTLTAALLVLVPSRRFRIPPAVGFMITGAVLGPGALRLVGDPHHVEVLAEIGVSVLLFVIGLEFSLARLREIGRALLVGGPLQVLLTAVAVAAIVRLLPLGASLGSAVFAGMLISLSSTAMVLPLIRGRGEIHSPQGRLVLGFLLFQDFALVPMLALVPSLADAAAPPPAPRLLLGAAAAVLIFVTARLLMSRVVGAVIRSGVRELYVMMAVAVCLGASLATKAMGLSPALGAFLAGILVSESEYAHQIVAEILPFRDLFSSLFFVSIGMLLRPDLLLGSAAAVGGWVLLVVVLKTAIAAGVVRLLGFPFRIAVIVGISLAQVGEFSFVLASVGMDRGLLSSLQHQQFLAVAVATLALTPALVTAAAWAGARAGFRAGDAPPPGAAAEAGAAGAHAPALAAGGETSGHVIVVGYGVNGRNLARVLREVGIPYRVLEVDPALVRRAERDGQPIRFGDVSRREGLEACGVRRAAVVVLAISDPTATRIAVSLARTANPAVHIIARTRLVSEVAELARLGADEVIPEEFETSIAIFNRVLRRFHVPGNVVRLQEQALRREGYGFLRGADPTGSLLDSVTRMLAGATTDTYYLEPDSAAVGRSLQDLDLRARTRALVIAVVRDGKHHLGPEETFTFRPGDILVLVGDHASLDAAFEALGPPSTSWAEDEASREGGTGPGRSEGTREP